MATYVCSDIHGQYDLFMKLLEKINFSSADSLYILGDMIDKGDKSIALIDYIKNQHNIHCILDNHEYFFLNYYESLMKTCGDEFDEKKVLDGLQKYFPYDNSKITWEIMDYLETLPNYIETECFIGVHAGLKLDKNNKVFPMKEQTIQYMIFDRSFKDAKIINPFGKPIILGHTPCNYDNQTGKFVKQPNIISSNIKDYTKIRLDNGVQYTQMFGVLRIEDMQEIYVR